MLLKEIWVSILGCLAPQLLPYLYKFGTGSNESHTGFIEPFPNICQSAIDFEENGVGQKEKKTKYVKQGSYWMARTLSPK